MIPTWDEIKQDGQNHYKTGDVEPIDLYKAGGILQDGIIWNIIKNAYRSRREARPTFADIQHFMTEIIHYANMLMAYYHERELQRIRTITSKKAE